jgi:hypothetical protein
MTQNKIFGAGSVSYEKQGRAGKKSKIKRFWEEEKTVLEEEKGGKKDVGGRGGGGGFRKFHIALLYFLYIFSIIHILSKRRCSVIRIMEFNTKNASVDYRLILGLP